MQCSPHYDCTSQCAVHKYSEGVASHSVLNTQSVLAMANAGFEFVSLKRSQTALTSFSLSCSRVLCYRSSLQNSASRRCVQGHGDAVLGLAFSADGSCLATVCQDRMARVFDLAKDIESSLGYRHKKLTLSPLDIAFGPTSGHFVILSSGALGLTAPCERLVQCPITLPCARSHCDK